MLMKAATVKEVIDSDQGSLKAIDPGTSYAMLVEDAEFKLNTTYITTDELYDASLPMVIDWAIGTKFDTPSCNIALRHKPTYACISSNSHCLTVNDQGYLCNCTDGYEGNPYLDGCCQDIDECANQNACSKRGKCHNFEGEYRCSCPFGWRNKHNNMRECEVNVAPIIGTCDGIAALSFLAVGIYVVLERRFFLFF
ncbi:wall-associated receptor kinase 2-like [Carex rostrata]